MKKLPAISLTNVLKPLAKMVSRSQLTIFIILVVAGLISAVVLLNSLIKEASVADDYTSPVGAGSIDQATLDRIKELHTSDQGAPVPTFPEGRINPFGE